MFKMSLLIGLIAFLNSLALVTSAFAQDNYEPNFSASTTPSKKSLAGSSLPTGNLATAAPQSEKDFTSSVNKAYQQNQDQLNQQVQQQKQDFIKNIQNTQINEVKNTQAQKAQQQSNSTNNTTPTTEVAPQATESSFAPAEQANPGTPPTTAMPSSPQASPSGTSNQPYTGFGAGNNSGKSTKNTGPQKSSGGWNIQY